MGKDVELADSYTGLAAEGPQIERLLRWMGDTPSDVVSTLIGAGVTGIPGDSLNCPIKNYLARLGINVRVHGGWLGANVWMPQSVAMVLGMFDARLLPVLEDPNWREQEKWWYYGE